MNRNALVLAIAVRQARIASVSMLLMFASLNTAYSQQEFPISPLGSVGAGKRVLSLASSTDGRVLIAGMDDGQVVALNPTALPLAVRSLGKASGKVIFVGFTADSAEVINASENGTIARVPLAGGGTGITQVKLKGKIRAAAMMASRGFFATASEKTVTLRRLDTFDELAVLSHTSRQDFVSLQFTATGDWLVGLCKDGSMWKWKTSSPTERGTSLPSSPVDEVHASYASGCSNILSLSTETSGQGNDPNPNGGGGGGYTTLKTTSNTGQNNTVVVGQQNTAGGPGIGRYVHAEIRLFDLDRNVPLPLLEVSDTPINGIAFSPDNRLVASVRGNFLDVQRLQNGERVVSMPLHRDGTAVVFDPKGQWLAAGTEKGELLVFSVDGVRPGSCVGLSSPKIQITSIDKSPLLAAAKNLQLAVVDFDANSVDPGLARTMTETLRSRIRRPPDIEVVERKELMRVLDELHLSMTDLVDPKNALKLGSGVSANRFLFGSVNKIADAGDGKSATYRLNVRLVDVTTSLIGGEREVTCRPCTADDLLDAADLLATALVN